MTTKDRPVYKARRRNKPKDPNAPKRPLSAFFRFKATKVNEVKRVNPGATIYDIGKIMGTMWQALPLSQKVPF